MKNKGVSTKNQTAGKSSLDLLKEKRAELRRDEDLLTAKKDEIHVVSLDANQKAIVADEARRAATRYRNETRSQNNRIRNNPELDKDQQMQMNRLENAATEAETAATAADEKRNRLNDEISDLQQGLAGMKFDFNAEDVLAYQEEKAKAEKVVAALADSIGQQEIVIEKAQGMIPAAEDFNGQREDLLAEIATGAALGSELVDLDQRAAASSDAVKKASAEAQEIIAPCRQTINGLRRKLATAQDELSIIKATGPEVMNQFYRSEAERIGSEYAALALQLIDKYEKLLAYDKMLGHTSQFRNLMGGEIMLPTFRVKACEGLQHHRDMFEFKAARLALSNERQAEVYSTELARMKAMGIDV